MTTRWSPSMVACFEATLRPWMRLSLSGIYITGLPNTIPERMSVLLVANHVSWWDGFILREVHRRMKSRCPLLTIMRADQLHRFRFFRWMGVVGLSSSPSGLRSALRQIDAFQHHGPVWVSYFPQGRIWPSRRRPLGFRDGIRLFIEPLRPVLILPVGIHLEPLARPAPTVFVAVREGVLVHAESEAPSVEQLETTVGDALCFIHDQLDQWGEETPARWPSEHHPIPAGTPEPAALPSRVGAS